VNLTTSSTCRALHHRRVAWLWVPWIGLVAWLWVPWFAERSGATTMLGGGILGAPPTKRRLGVAPNPGFTWDCHRGRIERAASASQRGC